MGESDAVERRHDLTDVRPLHRRSSGGSASAASVEANALRRVIAGVGALYDRAVDAVLATPHLIRDERDALQLLDERGSTDDQALAERIGKLAMVATPVLTRMKSAGRLAKLAKLPGAKRVPLIASVTTVASVGAALNRGVRDVQVIGSYVATRIERTTGEPPDPELVKRLTVQLYLSPSTVPRLDKRVPTAKLLRKWLVRGALGRDSKKAAQKAVAAVTRLDVPSAVAWWRANSDR